MNIKQKIKEHDELISKYEKKIKKYQSLIEIENDRFSVVQDQIDEKHTKNEIKKILALLKEKPYILMMEFDKLINRLSHNKVIEIIDIEVEMTYVGSHSVDNDYHTYDDSLKIELDNYRIGHIDLNGAQCDENDVKEYIKMYHNDIDESASNNIVDRCTYEEDDIARGLWRGVITVHFIKLKNETTDNHTSYK